MRAEDTKQRILKEAVKLFARDGFDAVTVGKVAAAVGIKAPSLYKHYKSKQDIFSSVLKEMERRDAENAAEFSLPQDEVPDPSGAVSPEVFAGYCRRMFRYWTEDEFASSFRRMLTVEQYRSGEMNALYHQYLGSGPLRYTAELLGSEEKALALYGPMFLLYSVYDREEDKDKAYELLDRHLDRCLEL